MRIINQEWSFSRQVGKIKEITLPSEEKFNLTLPTLTKTNTTLCYHIVTAR